MAVSLLHLSEVKGHMRFSLSDLALLAVFWKDCERHEIILPLLSCVSINPSFSLYLPLRISDSMWKAAGFVTRRPSSVSHMQAKHMLECNLLSQPRAKKKDH